MKQAELRNHTTCNKCRKPVGHTRLPLFWRVTIERFGIDLSAVRRQDGLSALIGSSVIAAAMGPDEDLAVPVMDKLTLTICEECACSTEPLCIAALAELPAEIQKETP